MPMPVPRCQNQRVTDRLLNVIEVSDLTARRWLAFRTGVARLVFGTVANPDWPEFWRGRRGSVIAGLAAVLRRSGRRSARRGLNQSVAARGCGMRPARSRQSARLGGGVIASARRLAWPAPRPAEADPVDAPFPDSALPAWLVSRAILAPASEIAADPAARYSPIARATDPALPVRPVRCPASTRSPPWMSRTVPAGSPGRRHSGGSLPKCRALQALARRRATRHPKSRLLDELLPRGLDLELVQLTQH
jgi:hypothetical protein